MQYICICINTVQEAQQMLTLRDMRTVVRTVFKKITSNVWYQLFNVNLLCYPTNSTGSERDSKSTKYRLFFITKSFTLKKNTRTQWVSFMQLGLHWYRILQVNISIHHREIIYTYRQFVLLYEIHVLQSGLLADETSRFSCRTAAHIHIERSWQIDEARFSHHPPDFIKSEYWLLNNQYLKPV